MNDLFLTGRDRSNIIHLTALNCDVHSDLLAPLQALREIAQQAGHDLAIASAYRGFDRQLLIWNAKARGERPVLSLEGKVLDLETLSDWEKVQAILTWSALPGASRHHWGSDLDVFNPLCMPPDYQLQLTQAEYLEGVQCNFNQWLSQLLDAGRSDFFRPYQRYTGGIAPEPWHISYRPLADQCQAALTRDVLADALETADLCLKSCVLNHLDEILERFVRIGI